MIETQLSNFNPFLVLLSYLISVCGGFTALVFARESLHVAPRERVVWIVWAAVILGSVGVWAMHFVGMMAYDMGMPVNYNFLLTVLSMIFAIVGCAIGFGIVGMGSRSMAAILAGGSVMGLAVAAMHYTGMLAMRMPAQIHWDGTIVWVSLAIAIVASVAALWMAFNLSARWQMIAAAMVAGIAVCGMHYTGMFAWSYTMLDQASAAPLPSALSPTVVGGGLFLLSLIVLLVGMALTRGGNRTLATAAAEPEVAATKPEVAAG